MLLLPVLIVQQEAKAQANDIKAYNDSVALSNQMDVVDLAKLIFKRKIPRKAPKPKKVNLNGPFITGIPYPNYTIATGVSGALPINIAFYTSKKEHGRLSFVNSIFQYTQYKQAIVTCWSNIFFHHDKWSLIGDWRFYKYPTYTFGLGSRLDKNVPVQIDYSHIRLYEQLMHRVAPNMDLGIGYHFDYRMNIRDMAAEEGIETDFQRYGFAKTSISSGFSLDFLYDSRDNQNNAKRGFYMNIQLRTFLKGLGSSSNYQALVVDCRKYIPFTRKWDAGVALWGYVWLTTFGKPPYLDLPSTGWDTYNNTGRGYAVGRFRGLNMLYFETEIRVSLMRNGLLGAVVFGNLQSFAQWPDGNFGPVQPAGGIGLRIKLNKRTNTNSAIDYAFGAGKSKGLAFNLNEVF